MRHVLSSVVLLPGCFLYQYSYKVNHALVVHLPASGPFVQKISVASDHMMKHLVLLELRQSYICRIRLRDDESCLERTECLGKFEGAIDHPLRNLTWEWLNEWEMVCQVTSTGERRDAAGQ